MKDITVNGEFRKYGIPSILLWTAAMVILFFGGLLLIGRIPAEKAFYLAAGHFALLVAGVILLILVFKRFAHLDAKCKVLEHDAEVKKKEIDETSARWQHTEETVQRTAVMAHDFNNALTSIATNAYLLKKMCEQGDPGQILLEEILSESARAAILTKQLLALSRNRQTEPRQPITSRPPLSEPEQGAAEFHAPAERETILLADDEAAVRRSTGQLLRQAGYVVLEAVDGEDLSMKFIENMDSINLLVTDIIMPRMNGKEAYDEVKRIKPGLKVLFISGYSSNIIDRKSLEDEGLTFISKPVQPEQFLKTVRLVLDK